MKSLWHYLAHGLSWLLVLPIRFYQLCISPLLGPSCRFTPTCSEYARQAILKHGPFKGLYLGVRRLLRCHPWGGSDYDPVNNLSKTKLGDFGQQTRRLSSVNSASLVLNVGEFPYSFITSYALIDNLCRVKTVLNRKGEYTGVPIV